MPRVSEEHLEQRRRQILDAARRCFIRQGVHATSMQDIFAESGLSAGAVYRYFKSKVEIIEAIMGGVIDDLRPFLAELVDTDPILPLDVLVLRITRHVTDIAEADGLVKLAPQAWALALYDADLREYVQLNLAALRENLIRYARRCVDKGLLPPGTNPVAAGKTLFGMLPGFLLQRLITEDTTPEDIATGVRALVRTGLLDLTTKP